MSDTGHNEILRTIFRRASVARVDGLRSFSVAKRWGIYGAGRIGKRLASALQAKGKSVDFFLDASAAIPKQILGVPCMRKDHATERMKSARVVVALHNPEVDSLSVMRQLREDGFTDVVLLQDVVDNIDDISNFWLAPRLNSLQNESILETGLSLMADDTSRAIYLSTLAFRLLGDDPPPPEADQYFPASLPAAKVPLQFVDVGAYDGDTLDYIVSKGYPIEWCIAFEPDVANYAQLSLKHESRATLMRCGLSNAAEDVWFTADGSAGRMGAGDVMIRTATLDSLIANHEVNFIKMDIEGAEPAAIEGSRETILRHQPRLALASYHHPLHMASLAIQLRDLGYEGTFHLRAHARNSFETVLYGLPRA